MQCVFPDSTIAQSHISYISYIRSTCDTASQNAGLGSTNDPNVAGTCLLREAIHRALGCALSARLES
jgi:hypothetical protein